MSQDQDQNDNLFNFDSTPSQPPADEPTILSGSAQEPAAQFSQESPEPQPVYTPPPPVYAPPPAYNPPPGSVTPAPAKKNRTWLIVVIVLLVLCCCCLAVAVSGYYWWGDALMQSLGVY